MDIQFLGTGAGQPSKARNVSSLALRLLDEINEVWLFDCGEGTQNRILETTIRPRKVSKIFITHLHGDHIFGLPGFLSSRAFQANEEQTDLEIYGPQGIKSFVLTSLRVSGSRLPYRIHFHEFDQDSLGKILETDKFTVYAEELDHTIFCVGYRVMQKDLEGTLDAENLRPLVFHLARFLEKSKTVRMLFSKMGLKSRQQTISQLPVRVRLSPFLVTPEKPMPVCV
ncbi:metallo-beta-lactamase domain protein [Streptococcus oralis SK313]|uniref:Metallo-beta-lactamase domain protein n=1 Tax=Streptococcus oralis SK313 TaxID=1035190 RepID=F9Q4E0_STROR|nr:metallo-beta-lactamase domain protein [Streptococcus oralis SK313]